MKESMQRECHSYRDGVVEMKEARCRAHGFQMVVKQPPESRGEPEISLLLVSRAFLAQRLA